VTTAASARRINRRYLLGYSGPALVITTALVVAPLLYAIGTSFFRYSFATAGVTPVGIDNYLRAFTDAALLSSLIATGAIVGPALVIEMVLGLAWALAINALIRGRAVVTTLLALPVMVSGASAGMAFRMIFTPEWGPADNVIRTLTGGVSVDWLGNAELARTAIVIADVWQNTPFVMLISLAALASIPKEINEAASVDGATAVTRFTQITFPLIRKFLLVALLFRLIDLFRMFDVIFTMTNGGPASATETINFYIYRQGIEFFDLGYAAALGIGLAIVTLIVSRGLIRLVGGKRR
jgi:multiple sugar transport system permease protein